MLLRPCGRPKTLEIPAPEFPPRMDWLNVAFLRMDKLIGPGRCWSSSGTSRGSTRCARCPTSRPGTSATRTLGLRVIGVHSPGYSFGRDPTLVARRGRAARDRVRRACSTRTSRSGACTATRAGPAATSSTARGMLRFIHYGEGDYVETELADPGAAARARPRRRAARAARARCAPRTRPACCSSRRPPTWRCPPTATALELVRDWTDGEDFIEAADAGAAAGVTWSGGEAYAVLSGAETRAGPLRDRRQVVAESPGLRLHGFQFTPQPPPAPS